MTREPGPAQELFSELQRTAWPRRWLVAAALGVLAGFVMGLVVSWPLDLITAVVVAGACLAWDRRHGNLAALWPTHRGQNRVAAIAARLELKGWVYLRVPDPSPPNCCLLVGPPGVFVIQHEAAPVTTDVHTGLIVVGTRSAVRHVRPLRVVTDAVHVALSAHVGRDVAVSPVLATESGVLINPRVVTDVTILSAPELLAWLRRHDLALSQEMVDSLSTAARRLFDAEPRQK